MHTATHQAEFREARLVEVYDAQNTWGPDDDYFLARASEGPGPRVLDLGCGTGRLTVALAAAGRAVTGIDPAGASLDAARRRPGGEAVTWVHGTSADAPAGAFDVTLMTSHVAQFFVADDEWAGVLADVRAALVPGGILVFDTRDPRDRAWEAWHTPDERDPVLLGDGRVVQTWCEITGERDGVVDFTLGYEMPEGDELLSTATLRFRPEDEVRASVEAAGFVVEQVFGGWACEPVGHGAGELLVVARAL
ncbi:class I SAM-dependent methyltransferase [Oerskovia jenensis]|uniref:class I SAM-dependent methyltransferase n=1 Tax=Oerskovia jenensis TaxID=162169 RepID=UPI0036DF906B